MAPEPTKNRAPAWPTLRWLSLAAGLVLLVLASLAPMGRVLGGPVDFVLALVLIGVALAWGPEEKRPS